MEKLVPMKVWTRPPNSTNKWEQKIGEQEDQWHVKGVVMYLSGASDKGNETSDHQLHVIVNCFVPDFDCAILKQGLRYRPMDRSRITSP